MKSKVVLVISSLLMLSACGVSSNKPTQQIQTSDTPIAIPNFTSTPTHTSQPPSTPTLVPTKTLEPYFATQQALHNNLDKYCERGNSNRIAFSPNGQWAGLECNYGSIKIVRMDVTKEWELPYESMFGPYSSPDLFIEIPHWSRDGAYVYVGANPHTDGYWEPFHSVSVLHRFNLETGQITDILFAGKDDNVYYSFAFSPDDTILAYIVTDQSPVILNLRDLQAGTELSFEFDPKFNTGGAFIWSPGSQKLVFSITQFDLNTYEYVATSIVLWDRDKANITMLIKDGQEILVPIDWINESKITLQVLYEEDTKFEYDLTKGELRQVSP